MITIEFTIPKNTPMSKPYTRSIDMGINAPVVKSINVTIPQGHKGLAFMRAWTPSAQLVPLAGSSTPYIRGENTAPNFICNKKIEGPPYYIYLEGYNEDPFLPHTFILNIEV